MAISTEFAPGFHCADGQFPISVTQCRSRVYVEENLTVHHQLKNFETKGF